MKPPYDIKTGVSFGMMKHGYVNLTNDLISMEYDIVHDEDSDDEYGADTITSFKMVLKKTEDISSIDPDDFKSMHDFRFLYSNGDSEEVAICNCHAEDMHGENTGFTTYEDNGNTITVSKQIKDCKYTEKELLFKKKWDDCNIGCKECYDFGCTLG